MDVNVISGISVALVSIYVELHRFVVVKANNIESMLGRYSILQMKNDYEVKISIAFKDIPCDVLGVQ